VAIFGKDGAVREESRGAAGGEAMLSIIASGMTIIGDIESAGIIKIDGRVDGSVTGARQVLLGRGGSINGNIVADEVVIGGSVRGALTVRERLELQGTAAVVGDIETRSIVVIEGARIDGTVRMADVVASPRSPAQAEPLRIAAPN
jgi:cytoskeletal protein CcmA (bactofilin family)